MSNHSLRAAAPGGLPLCPLLLHMRNQSTNTKANVGLICIHGLVSALGILENALILWVVGFRLRRRTVSSVWVLNLALSDLLATLTLPLFTFYLKSASSWELGNPLCKIQASIFFLNMFVSAFLLAAISLDRCLLITKPVWSQNHRSLSGAWRVCGLGWLWAAANTLPYFFFRSVTEKEDGKKLCYHNYALLWSSGVSLDAHCKRWQAGTAVSKLLLAFLLPLAIIAASYVQISLALRTRRRKQRMQSTYLRHPSSSSSQAPPPPLSSPTCHQSSQLSQNFTRMVTFVITAFVVCWAPYHIFCVIEVAAGYRSQYLKLVEVGLLIATTIAFINPVLNPILYVFSCPNFCMKIQESVGAVFDAVVEEGGGLLSSRKNSRHHIAYMKKSSQDPAQDSLGFKGLVSPNMGEEVKSESMERQVLNPT